MQSRFGEEWADDVFEEYDYLVNNDKTVYGSFEYMEAFTNLAIDASKLMKQWEREDDTKHSMYLVARVIVLHWQRLNSCLLLGHDPQACTTHGQITMEEVDPEFPTSFR